MTGTIKVTDRGLTDRLHVLSGLSDYEVVVGVLADGKGAAPAKGAEGMTVLDLATIHEFGAPASHIPQRSFVRAYVDENREQIRAWQRGLLTTIFAGRITAQQALNQLGAKVAAGIQTRIAAGIAPPNAQSTIDRKGSSTPLIDTGQLRSSVTWAVRRKAA